MARKSANDAHNTNWSQYKTWRNRSVHLIRNAKNSYIKTLLNDKSTNSKQIWRILKSTINLNKAPPPLSLVIDNVRYDNLATVSNLFNEYFTNIQDKFDMSGAVDYSRSAFSLSVRQTKFSIPPITIEEVSGSLKQLNPSKATGIDGLPAHFLKFPANMISNTVTTICNLSISTGIFPALWKKAKLIPIYKSGEMSERGNFRPISILVILSKIIERHVFNSYFLYLTEHEILSDYQHGFRPGHSCETSLNMIYEYLVNNIDNGEINGVLMLDFSKAFDLVDHTILLQKIHAYGTTDLTLK